ncbi:MAG: cytochrome P460 family protein [Myxococcota bacterium]|nr:cytochrome P460 family protein [Myxococcota bacterium]
MILVGCSSHAGDKDAGTALAGIFPAAFRSAGYNQVRACRFPGEHSALNGFTVWADDAGASLYMAILAGDAGGVMPAGSVVIKELYASQACDPSGVDHWVAMKKVTGYDPDHGDWMWQELAQDGTVKTQGREAACYRCHQGGANTTCDGYGAANGKDYLCTAP